MFEMSKLPLRVIALASLCMAGLSQVTSTAAPFDKVENKSETSLATYQKVYIAPVTIKLAEPATRLRTLRRRASTSRDQRIISQQTQDLKAAELHTDLKRSFSKNFTVVNSPASDVLTVAVEITRLIPSRPTVEERSRGIAAVSGAGSISAGGASYSVVLSTADEELYSIQEQYRSSLSDNIVRVTIWQDTDHSFNQFSKKLARFVKNN